MHALTDIYVVGDVHGYYDKLTGALRSADLITDDDSWAGGDARLWFLGDFFDRGPNGIQVVDFVMRLQQEAAEAGGAVESVIGNHELHFLSAAKFGEGASRGPGKTFMADWKRNGGQDADLEALEAHHIEWLTGLPSLAVVDGRLLLHADAPLYLDYGDTVEAINERLSGIIKGDDAELWDDLLSKFSKHGAFRNLLNGKELARRYLEMAGAQQLIHGHTPISRATLRLAKDVTEPHIYNDGLCVNVDQALYLGGPGFVYRMMAATEIGVTYV